DPPFAPSVIGDSLVVQAPNHLQGIAVVDLYVRDGSYRFADGSGLEAREEQESLARRIEELKRRLAAWERPDSGLPAAEVEARRKELRALEERHAAFEEPKPPKSGSYFRYELVQVRESFGVDQKVARRLEAYYKRV